MTQIKFSECMNLLLTALDISINRLSKAINVDCSLVNRWIHGVRVPAYHTTYVENISEFLSQNVLNSFHQQHVNKLFQMVWGEDKKECNVKDKIKSILLEAQGYSLECKKAEKKERKARTSNREQLFKLLNNQQFMEHKEMYFDIDTHDLVTKQHISSFSLSSDDKVIIGSRNVSSAVLSLLDTAAEQACKNSDTIYISLNNDTSVISRHDDLVCLRNILVKAISNGWNVLCLIRLNNNLDRTIAFINFALPLIETGKFAPYYLKKYDIFTTGKETIIVPGNGVLSCFTTKKNAEIDSALYMKNQMVVDIYSNYFNVLLDASAQSLINYYAPHEEIKYAYCLIENEENTGRRFTYKNEFSMLMLSTNLYKKFLRKKNLSESEIQKSTEFQQRRLNAFLSNLQNFEHKDIYWVDSVEYLILYKQLNFYSYMGSESLALEIEDIIGYLQNIIYLLERYDNYNIAFMHHNSENNKKHLNFCFIVKERQAVILRTLNSSNGLPEVRLSIKEPMLVKAFEEYFKDMWEHIAPVNKEKKEIINWLKSKIDFLKKSS